MAPASSTLGEQLGRFTSAIKRYKWLIVAVVAVGSSVGYALTQLVQPKYRVDGSIIIKKTAPGAGPISAPGLISDPASWVDLTRSFIVLDQVVQRLGLYVEPKDQKAAPLLSDLRPSATLQPGQYQLRLDASGTRYELIRPAPCAGEQDVTVETGAVGDSIGRAAGIYWRPEAGRFPPGSTTEFTVMTARDAAVRLYSDLQVMPVGANTNIMRLQMTGKEPVMLAKKMNTLLDQFVKEAGRLSKSNLETVSATVEEQMDQAKAKLHAAEASLEAYSVNTITLPSDNAVVAPGVAMAHQLRPRHVANHRCRI